VERGFDVLDIQGLNIASGWDMGLVTPAYCCGGVRSLEAVEEIEQITGKPVITSNQAQMWSCLRRAGVMDELEGFGQIFKHPGIAIKPTI